MRTEPVGESAYVALCIHPVGAELGGVRATDDTARENQWAHTEAGEKPPSGAYESDAVRRLDTTPPPPAGSADGRSRRGGQTGGGCNCERKMTKHGRPRSGAGLVGGRVRVRAS